MRLICNSKFSPVQMVRRLLDLATGEDARLALFEAALPLTHHTDYPPR